MKMVTDCFGRTMKSDPENRGHNWGDVCPFCQNVSLDSDSRCTNPACVASRWAAPELVIEEDHRQALLEQEDRTRMRNHELAMERIREGQERRDRLYSEAIVEAKKLGACTNPRCLWPAYREPGYRPTKYVKHRKGCTKETARCI